MITASQKAIIYMRNLVIKSKLPIPPAGIRLAVKAGGCHDLSYVYTVVDKSMPNDKVIDLGGLVKIFVDPKSLKYLEGTNIEYSNNLIDGPLVFKNPNAQSGCGCGNSFSPKPKE